jgi:large subunit ribosomal protein L10
VKRLEKIGVVSNLNSSCLNNEVALIVHYKGMNVVQLEKLRAKLREVNAKFCVAKNSLINLAVENTNHVVVRDILEGPSAVAFCNDPVAVSKVLFEQTKEANNKMIIVGGSYNGSKLSFDDIKILASLPSLIELKSKIVGLIMAPASKIARVVQTPAGNVARVLSAYSKK